MLPGDITGSSILDQKRGVFEFHPGPVFANVLLVDEINRATPKTQSALLEAMAERKVSADGMTYELPRPFVVLATQNPIEQAGTFPLPEAQLDRFLFKLSMGYLDRDSEFEVMFDNSGNLLDRGTGLGHRPEDGHGDDRVRARRSRSARGRLLHRRSGPRIARRRRSGHGRTAPRRHRPHARLACWPPATAASTSIPTTCAPCSGPCWPTVSIMNPDAILRGETVDAVIERLVNRVKPPMSGSSKELSKT